MTTFVTDAPPPPSAPDAPMRYATIRANLLPDELIATRRVSVLKRRIAIGLAGLLVLLILGYGVSWWQTSSSHDGLAAAQRDTTALLGKQNSYTPLVDAQNQSATIQTALRKLMVGDLSWTEMIAVLGKSAGGGVVISQISGQLTAGAAAGAAPTSGGFGVLNETGKQAVGSITLTGTAPDKNAVAAFVDKLSVVPGLAAPFPASVSAVNDNGVGSVQYSVSVLITSDALGGRYSQPATGGK